jgi:hypothetical protein
VVGSAALDPQDATKTVARINATSGTQRIVMVSSPS